MQSLQRLPPRGSTAGHLLHSNDRFGCGDAQIVTKRPLCQRDRRSSDPFHHAPISTGIAPMHFVAQNSTTNLAITNWVLDRDRHSSRIAEAPCAPSGIANTVGLTGCGSAHERNNCFPIVLLLLVAIRGRKNCSCQRTAQLGNPGRGRTPTDVKGTRGKRPF
jgi:hypothetical protein